MTERLDDIELADRYVRNKLAGDVETEFEVRMLENPELQQHVQTALAIRASLRLEEQLGDSSSGSHNSGQHKPRVDWGKLAIAASVLLVVVSTVMLAKSSIESNQLERQIAELTRPRTSFLKVPVNIMRSVGSNTPDVIVQMPSINSVIQLDIELSGKSQVHSSLRFDLESDEGISIATWKASASENGRTVVLFRSELIPAGFVHLRVSDVNGNILDRHLLEFRAPVD